MVRNNISAVGFEGTGFAYRWYYHSFLWRHKLKSTKNVLKSDVRGRRHFGDLIWTYFKTRYIFKLKIWIRDTGCSAPVLILPDLTFLSISEFTVSFISFQKYKEKLHCKYRFVIVLEQVLSGIVSSRTIWAIFVTQ